MYNEQERRESLEVALRKQLFLLAWVQRLSPVRVSQQFAE
jgi:hypothetical protein